MSAQLIPSEESVVYALESLRVTVDDASPLHDDAAFYDVACTLAEEVDYTQAFCYDPDEPEDIPSLHAFVESRGFQGDVKNRAQVLDFLAAEAQASRLLSHAADRAPTKRPGAKANTAEEAEIAKACEATPADVSIASSVSKICQAVGMSADEAGCIEDVSGLVTLLDKLAIVAGEHCAANGTLHRSPLIDPEAARRIMTEKLPECTRVSDALAAEHELRKGLLLRRLEVTIQSFGYSARAAPDGFESVRRAALRIFEDSEQPVGVFDALVARDWLLDIHRVGATDKKVAEGDHGVRTVMIGGVPDRGGRIGLAALAKADMPKFAPRSADPGPGASRGRGRHGRGKKRNRR